MALVYIRIFSGFFCQKLVRIPLGVPDETDEIPEEKIVIEENVQAEELKKYPS